MKKNRLQQMQTTIIQKLGPAQGNEISAQIKHEYDTLCQNDSNRPKDLIHHLHKNIFPAIATFHALQKAGMSRQKAIEFTQESFLELMEKPASTIRKLCKFPGIYHLVPTLFKTMMPKLFKKEAGFSFQIYPTNHQRAKFDMLKCPYYEICQELNCPELAPIFCQTDDICYGNMHPKLCWKRTQTIARGGTLCDFDIRIQNKKS